MALSPPTALWVIPVSDLGGVARHVRDVVRHGIPGYRVVVLCPPGPLASAVAQDGAAVLTAPLGPDFGLRESRRAVHDAVRTVRPAVIHSHLSYADLVVALTAPRHGPALVSTEHGIAVDDEIYHSGPIEAAVMARAHGLRLRRLDALIAVSDATADAVRHKWRPQRSLDITVIPNGVDRPDQSLRRPPGLRIVSIARLAPEKGLPALLEGFAALAGTEPGASLTLAGDGSERAGLEQLAGRLGVTDRVTFLGHTDPEAALAQADVLAQLSVWENCSYSVLDAVVAGVGVVATAVGGNPEILPPQCLLSDTRPDVVAGALRDQGLGRTPRPLLPETWPSVDEMCRRTAEMYARARAASGKAAP